MIPRTYKILLIISIVFNFAFIGGYIYQKVYRPLAPSPNEMPPHFREHFAEHRADIMPLRQDYIHCRHEFMLELAKPNVTRQQLEEKLAETLEKQKRMERQVGFSLIKMRMDMSDQQAQNFFENQCRPHRNPRKFKNQN
ncbi:MAG TPA: hypothetical protein DHM37_09190 [Candidatus Cloacimonas sp.]|jgi:hypothetical protein|nr:hypothetical protein [Candidatus Cloacimonadota bacterium]HCX73878.1 hypothetical protein [Candidatus Cloacimonas sp.]